MVYWGTIALHERQSTMQRRGRQGHEDEEHRGIQWIEYVRSYGDARHSTHPYSAELVYVNLRRGLIWPAPTHLRNCGTMHLLASHLEYSNTVHAALHVIRHELVSFGHYPLRCIACTMASSVWRLLVDKCYEYLTYAGNATHEEALVALAQPVTIMLSYLGIQDVVDVCWHIDWPNNRF